MCVCFCICWDATSLMFLIPVFWLKPSIFATTEKPDFAILTSSQNLKSCTFDPTEKTNTCIFDIVKTECWPQTKNK